MRDPVARKRHEAIGQRLIGGPANAGKNAPIRRRTKNCVMVAQRR